MNVKADIKITVKDVPKEIVTLGTDSAKDCLKILLTEALKNSGYDCEISDVTIEEVICNENE